jgi:transposase
MDEAVANVLLRRQLRENQRLAAENTELQARWAELTVRFEESLQLVADAQRLATEVQRLTQENTELKTSLAAALERIEELQRIKARQAAPFRRDKKGGDGKPGRKPGGRGTQRQRPPVIDREINVPLEATKCPKCECPLDERQPLTQIIEEIPPIRPEVTRLTTWQSTCPCCGETVRSTHPLQVSLAQGAAGIHLGPRATALATILKSHFGLTLRKTASILRQGFNLSITAGGISQLLHRVAQKSKPNYDELLEQIRGSDAVYADETSWYVGQPKAYLWVFTTLQHTLYHVDESRGRPVAEKILGDFDGVLVTDCAPMYNAIDCEQHKCIAHHLKVLREQRAREDNPDPRYLNACEKFWQDVIGLTKARDDLPAAEFDAQHAALKIRLEKLLNQPVRQPGDRKFQNRMLNVERESLLGCLNHRVEPTNNRAERAIRPAVIARKLSCGNKTHRGAQTWEILASQCATLYQQGKDLLAEFIPIVSLNPC